MSLFVVEGDKEVQYALQAGYQVHSLFIKEGCSAQSLGSDLSPLIVSPSVFATMALRESERLCAIMHSQDRSLSSLKLEKQGLYLAVCGVEKPGNLGAMFRSCDAVGVSGFVIVDPRCEVLNPNCIRSSLGTVFHVPWALCGQDMFHAWAQQCNVVVSWIDPRSQNIFEYRKPEDQPTILVVGSEHDGLRQDFCRDYTRVKIPMVGKNDSLNVSVAAAIMLYQLRP